jgi:hypothetical protein
MVSGGMRSDPNVDGANCSRARFESVAPQISKQLHEATPGSRGLGQKGVAAQRSKYLFNSGMFEDDDAQKLRIWVSVVGLCAVLVTAIQDESQAPP